MQLTSPRGNIIEKIVRDANGQLVRATFCVYEINGRMKVRLLHAVVIKSQVESEDTTVLSLNGVVRAKNIEPQSVLQGSIVSPFTYSSLLYFSGSKPRAPTY